MRSEGGGPPASDALRRIAESDPARPMFVGQLGQSLDGRIATISGDSFYINDAAGLDHLHRLRASVDAVLVGAGTVAADNPQLTVRRCAGRNPARIVIDPSGRLNSTARWLADDGARRILITRANVEPPPGVERLDLPGSGAFDPAMIVEALGRLGLRRVLVEGGARTISAFIDAGALDRLHLIVSSVIIGSGRSGLELRPFERLTSAMRPLTEVYRLGERDFLFDCDLRNLEEGGSNGA